ncbi:kinase-like protein [Gonapodya prolifera JEL478]|uniref:Kinase-like protein n=1 Tax=Gonapodya prolifera (strain JEL478) TaxID=1344416 RepID=A0A139AEC9_GONPJ|nr:kinase-like protein [Gonapodya prolifera JEL478]|eukprot:KXS15176.1 kinase-like protein [Gonapodya prolifera JEL478]
MLISARSRLSHNDQEAPTGTTKSISISMASDTTLFETSTPIISHSGPPQHARKDKDDLPSPVLKRTGDPDIENNWSAGKRRWPELLPGVRGNINVRDVALGDYIAFGGYSHVYRGVWQRDVEVGIKILSQLDHAAAFASELFTWATIPAHPNILRFYGVCFDACQPFMISPLMRNGSLLEYLHRFKPGPRDKIRLMIEIAKGIRHLHDHKIAHTNLHARLIVIDDQGHAIISSFGFAYDARESCATGALSSFVTDPDKLMEALLVKMHNERKLAYPFVSDIVSFARIAIQIWSGGLTMQRLREEGTAQESLVALLGRCDAGIGRMGVPLPTPEEIINNLHQILADLLATPGQQPLDTPWIQEEHVTFQELIGRGGYGEVFRGMWQGNEVALKRVFRGDMGRDLYTAFASEIEIWSSLKHDNVLPLSGACLTTTFPFIVSPFMKHGTALSYLRTVPTTTYQRIKLMLDVAQGMSYLHGVGIVHADLKASNVLVRDNGSGLVCDFGYAKLESAAAPKGTDPSERVGTPRWMPPERLLEHKSSKEGDVYAMGMTAYEIWTLERPFGDVPDARLWTRIIDGDLRPCLNSMVVEMPERLKELLEECWAPEPEDRPSFKVIEAVLQEILLACPVNVPMPQEPRPTETISAKVSIKRKRRDELTVNAGDLIKVLGRFSGGIEFGTLTTPEKGGYFVRTDLE